MALSENDKPFNGALEIVSYLKGAEDIQISSLHPNDLNHCYVMLTILSGIFDRYPAYQHKIKVGIKQFSDFSFRHPHEYKQAKQKDILDYFNHKIVITEKLKIVKNGDRYLYYGWNVTMQKHNNSVPLNTRLSPVPIFNRHKLTQVKNIREFINKLKTRPQSVFVINNPWMNKESQKTPQGIIWEVKGKAYFLTGVKGLSIKHYDGFKTREQFAFMMQNFDYIPLTSAWLQKQYRINDLVYLPANFKASYTKHADNHSYTKNYTKADRSKQVNYNLSHIRDQVLTRFINRIHQKDLSFKLSDIINFHVSVRTNALTILTGLSGDGKSQLAVTYAEAMEIDNEHQFNLVSVRPSWQDDADLLGFVDNLNHTYHPGDSGVLDTLLYANQHPDQLCLILLDEMNLSRVEYYFSQFLSVLEMSADHRYIKLYSHNLKLKNGDLYPWRVKIPQNVRFIGTMNVDETTLKVPDKVLDRANVITLKQQPFINKLNPNVYYQIIDHTNETQSMTYSKYAESLQQSHHQLNNDEVTFLDELNLCINQSVPTLGVSWRTLDRIEQFISNVSYYNYTQFNRGQALDYQIAQRVLPKIRGTQQMVGDLLADENNPHSIMAVLKQYPKLSNFEVTKKMLAKKAKEIAVIGFAN